jgi:uncharacterized repeat protein (TIGR01451 family)
MKFELYIVTAVALLAGRVCGKKSGGLRHKKTKVRVQLLYHVFAVVCIPFIIVLAHRIFVLACLFIVACCTFYFKQDEPNRDAQVHRKLKSQQYPVQTFFVPLPEVTLFEETFENIHRNANPPIISMISFSISTTDTVIWYDHWEDGYEEDVTNPTSSTTQVWGDGDSSNGCHPNVSSCTDSNDRFVAGDSVVIQNAVQIGSNDNPTRDRNEVFFDGADRIQSSFPIAVTRAAYPESPGSLMAGGVEVLDTSLWGKGFKAPVGETTDFETNGFEYSAFYVMAGEDDTKVYIKGSSTPTTLDMGESIHMLVNQGDIVTSDKDVQVDFLTGDRSSTYELRWYSLRATEDWSDKYLSPVGDSRGETKLVMYNPNTFAINVKITVNNGDKTEEISGGGHLVSDFIRTGSAALLEETDGNNFIVLSVTDTVGSGVLFDWGFPVVAVRDLTPQVLIGLGFGCTDNKCLKERYNKKKTRSVVWVTPVEDADIYVDYDNDGVVDKSYKVNYLDSRVIHDSADKDMSGAVIFATRRDSGPTGPQVNFAAAWGQDPSRSGNSDESGLDLGTLVVPFTAFQASTSKNVELVDDNDNDGEISPGDKIRYTIVVSNVGQQDIPKGGVTIKDTLDSDVSYVPNSITYEVPETGDSTVIKGSSFPLAGDGLASRFPFLKRGGTAEISYEVTINGAESISKDTLINEGTVTFGSEEVPVAFRTALRLAPAPASSDTSITIEKTVYAGHGSESKGNGSKVLTGAMDDEVTFSFKVTNTGSTNLDSVEVKDPKLNFVTSVGALAPGETKTATLKSSIKGEQMSMAEATGIPVYPGTQNRLPGTSTVRAEDDAGIEITVGDEGDEYLCE